MVRNAADVGTMTVPELSDLIRRAAQALAERPDPEAFAALTRSTAILGRAMGSAWSADWSDGSPVAPLPAAVPADHVIPMTMYGICEPHPGPRWRSLFNATWSGYRSWYVSDGTAARPDLDTCQAMLTRHMPELVPTWERMVELTGGDELAARMLTLWNPPRFLPGCSQAVLPGPTPVLVRNYDYGVDLFERVVYSSRFTGRRVLGTGDCLWGLLDGMNDAGLAISLAFGGRRGYGPGFGIPLVVRYLLEVASSIADVRRVLERLPVGMAYNVTVVDAAAETLTAFVAPGLAPEFTRARVATNHRGATPEDPAHARRFRSVERQQALIRLLATRPEPGNLAAAFLRAPLHSTAFSRAFGTLYTAVYRPTDGVVDYLWPETSWRRTFSSPEETKAVMLREPR
jgi:predicted choloylglycine hydrolase